MKKSVMVIVIAASYFGISSTFNLTFASEDMRSLAHPIIGYWEAKVEGESCSESYLFREDGTGLLTSGEETLEVSYKVDAQPNSDGYFKLTHHVVKTNGKLDCTKNITEANTDQENYLLFQPDGRSFIACDNDEASLETCFGPIILKNNALKNFTQ